MSAPLRLMAVHAHPDDESSKGAATMARYVAEGVDVLVCTLTGGERGSILNPKMERPEILENIGEVRRLEMERAREILGVRQRFMGFVDSGLPEDESEPLPEGCFALQPLQIASAPLVAAVREFRPHVILTYDDDGGYPHPDHIMTNRVSVEAFEAAGDPDRYPGTGEPWQPLKLYYHMGFTKERFEALHEAMNSREHGLPLRRLDLPLGGPPAEVAGDHPRPLRRLLRDPRRGAARARHAGRPGRLLVRLPARPAA